MPVKDLKPRGKGLEGRFASMELAGSLVAGRSKTDRLFTVRVAYDDNQGPAYRNRSEVFRLRKGTWENTTLLREEGEENPTLFPRYRPVPAWLVAELEAVRVAWESANPGEHAR